MPDSIALSSLVKINQPEKMVLTSPTISEDWFQFNREMKRFLSLSGITDEALRFEIFLSCIGKEAEKQFSAHKDFPNARTLQHLMDIGQVLFRRPKNEFLERHVFFQHTRKQGVSLLSYARSLYTYSAHCNFNNYSSDDAHIDAIIRHAEPRVRNRLLAESNLTLARTMEIVAASDIADEFNKLEPANKVIAVSKFKGKKTTPPNKGNLTCFRCGSKSHLANSKDCKARAVKCNSCGKTGHFSKFCKGKQAIKVSQISEQENFHIFQVNGENGKRYLPLSINGSVINFLVDTGSDVSIIPIELAKSLDLTLNKSDASLSDYNDRSIKTYGECTVTVRYKNSRFEGKVYVCNKSTPILGLNWFGFLNGVNWNALLKPHKNVTNVISLD